MAVRSGRLWAEEEGGPESQGWSLIRGASRETRLSGQRVLGVFLRGSCSQYSRWSLAGAHIASILTAVPLPSPLETCPSDPILFALQPSVGQVARVDVSSKVEVVWADNSKTIILPQVRPPGAHGSAPDSGSQAEGSGLPGEGIFFWEAGSWGKEGQC